jgi:hypothetical protein
MMRFALRGVLLVAVLPFVGPSPARADDAKDPEAVVAKAIKAKGGEANLKKYTATISEFKGKISSGGMELMMSGTTKEQLPDKFRLDATVSMGDMSFKVLQLVNGNKGWRGFNGQNAMLSKEELDEAREESHAGQLADLRGVTGKDVKLIALGDSKIDGKNVVGVRVVTRGHRDVELYFDKDGWILVKSVATGSDPQSTPAVFKSESYYSDYKMVKGLSVPHKVKVLRDGKPYLEMTLTSVDMLEKLDDKDFSKP